MFYSTYMDAFIAFLNHYWYNLEYHWDNADDALSSFEDIVKQDENTGKFYLEWKRGEPLR